MKKRKNVLLGCLLLACMAMPVKGQQTTFEKLNRGTVAVKTADGVLVSWRSLITDDADLAFNVYRDDAKINAEPITRSTNFLDREGTTASRYLVKPVLNGVETDEATSPTVDVWPDIYKRIHLQRPEKGEKGGTYTPNDCSVGDVDGDGDYELIVKWDPTNSHDNSENGYTDKVYLDCYEMEGGDYKWRIDLGRNIRAGAHYTQFMVYDLDGDGKAEVACKTAPGTVDGQGKYVLMGDDDPNADYRNSKGQVITGSEYLTVFNGETGAEITSVAYTPARGSASDWGDSYGGRSERYLACIAYLDGNKPSLVMCRGYYARTALAAYDFDGSNLTLKWLLDDKTSGSKSAYGQGNHNLSVGDVDGDGRDEIVYGACCIDDDGKVLYRTGLGHGDAMHLGDLDPGRPGLEVFCVHEEKSVAYGYEMHDAATGKIIHGVKTGTDVGRGLAADIDASHYGYEMWAQSSGVLDCKGNTVPGSRPSVNFRIYWDGDLQDELLDGRDGATKPSVTAENKAVIQKWNGSKAETLRNLLPFGVTFCNTTKGTPNLVADLIGDWREEVIAWDYNTCSDLVLFTTDIPTEHKVTTLMHDHVYRMGIAWQNVAYNQPPHLGYFLPDTDHVTAVFLNGSGSMNQSIEMGEPIESISYAWKNAEGVELTGELPDGVTFSADTDNKRFTIEGTPTVTGTFNFEVNTTGGETTATLSGTITIKPEAVLTELAYFPFDETSGTTAANMVYGQAEAVDFTPTWAEGVLGQALELPGTPVNRRMQQTHYDELKFSNKNFSIECWFRSNGGSGVDWYLLHKGDHADKKSWVGIQYKNGNLVFAIDNGITKTNLDVPATSYFNGAWHHLVCVRDRSNTMLKMYIDGVLQGEIRDMTGAILETDNLVIGNCNINFNTPFTGAIDELHIYEGAMSAKRVAERYNDPNVSGISSVETGRDEFVVYPALFTDEIAIQCPAEACGRCVMTIYSATDGRTVHQGIYNVDGGSVVYMRGLDGLAAGSYVLSIENGTERIVRKLLKANR